MEQTESLIEVLRSLCPQYKKNVELKAKKNLMHRVNFFSN